MTYNPNGLPKQFGGQPFGTGGLGGRFTGGVNLENGGQVHFHGPDLTNITDAYIKSGPQHGQYLNGYEASMAAIDRKTFSRKK